MARSQDPNSGSSQFFINLANNDFLNGKYTVFGRVVSGLETAQKIGNLPVNTSEQPTMMSQALVRSVTIQKAP